MEASTQAMFGTGVGLPHVGMSFKSLVPERNSWSIYNPPEPRGQFKTSKHEVNPQPVVSYKTDSIRHIAFSFCPYC